MFCAGVQLGPVGHLGVTAKAGITTNILVNSEGKVYPYNPYVVDGSLSAAMRKVFDSPFELGVTHEVAGTHSGSGVANVVQTYFGDVRWRVLRL
jgi:hypothetical protein